MASNHWFLLVVLGALSCVTVSVQLKQLVETPPASDEAYATLLYGDSFLLGVRVLGQSIRETQTKRDLVVIVTNDVSDEAQHTLSLDGWRVKRVEAVHNPGTWSQSGGGTGFPQKFWAVYTKLQIFNLVEYKKVIFLDADTIVLKNSDVLFQCPGFCAVLRHSERLNSGVMVVTPSTTLFQDMTSKISELPSYTGGDQGFLNSYYSDFANGFVFELTKDYSSSDYKYMRLPTAFNADIGLYVFNSNRWMIPREEVYVIHYTLGPFKPWVWWNSWLVREAETWEAYRKRLPADAAGRLSGNTPQQRVAETWLMMAPALLVALFLYQYGGGVLGEVGASLRQRAAGSLPTGRGVLPHFFIARSLAVGYGAVGLALGVVLWLVPSEVTPVAGWCLSFQWGLLVTVALFSAYLRHCHLQGQRAALTLASDHKAVSVRPWLESIGCGGAACTLLLLAPWAGRLLGVTSFVGTIMCTVFSAIGANVMLTHTFSQLPIKWFLCGRSEGVAGR